MFPVHIFDDVKSRDMLAAYLRFIDDKRSLVATLLKGPRSWYQIHHIAPRANYPQFIDASWNLIPLTHHDHREATEFCAALWGGGHWIAVELMTRSPLFFRPESAVEIARFEVIHKEASEERFRRSPLYDHSFCALVDRNPRRSKLSSGYRTFQIVLENPGIRYQDIFEFGPGECKSDREVGRDLAWDIWKGTMACDPWDIKAKSCVDSYIAWIERSIEAREKFKVLIYYDITGNAKIIQDKAKKEIRRRKHPGWYTKREAKRLNPDIIFQPLKGESQ